MLPDCNGGHGVRHEYSKDCPATSFGVFEFMKVFLFKEILVQDHFYRKYSTITSFFELDTLPSTPDDDLDDTLTRVSLIVRRG